jgi:hypothetical protein
MDRKKPSPKSPEERVEDLLHRRGREGGEGRGREAEAGRGRDAGGGSKERAAPGPAEGKGNGDPSRGRAPLTEEQRREARRLRREQRRGLGRGKGSSRRPGSGAGRAGARLGTGTDAGGVNPLSRGVRATGSEIRRAAGFLFAALLAGLDRLGPLFSALGGSVSRLLAGAARGLAAFSQVLRRGLHAAGNLLLAAERQVTPGRAAFAVAGAGVAALVISQFLDFRAIEIGRSGYSAVQEIARAPRVDVQTPMDAHSVLLLATAVIAAACVAGLAFTGRRVFALGLSLSGLATIGVAILIDLPQGLDTAEAEIAYTGVAAVLLTGFWLQIAAGVVLTATGLLLAVTGNGLQRSAGRSRRKKTRESRPGRNPSVGENPA